MWGEELQNTEFGRDIADAERMLVLHNDSASHMQNTTYQVLQSGQELLQVCQSFYNTVLLTDILEVFTLHISFVKGIKVKHILTSFLFLSVCPAVGDLRDPDPC